MYPYIPAGYPAFPCADRSHAFGNATFGSPQYDNEYTFNAESYNPNIRSQYLRARYYDTVKGSFLTEDSYLGDIRNPLTLNRYSYCIGNPLFYSDPSGHALKPFARRILFGDAKIVEAAKQKISEGDKWAQEVIRKHEDKKNKFMDDTYDWMGKNSPIKNNTTYGQVHNNFTAGVAGSVYNTVDTVTSPKYLAAKVYSVAAHPGRTLASINISGRDVARGLQGVAGKIKNKEYGSVARSAGYVAGSVAQAYGLSKGIEKCGDLLNKKKYGTGAYADGMPLEDVTASIEGGTPAKGLLGHDFEDYLTKNIGGDGSFSVSGRDFDGGVGNRWWEAKSGNYWNMLEEKPNELAKFKSDMGARLKIATENGASYELFSNTPIPELIKEWLTKKGIPFTEI